MSVLYSTEKNLERHGSRALTSIMAAGPGRSATIGRSFGHSIRHAMSMRYRTSLDFPRSRPSRPGSLVSLASNISEASSSSTIISPGLDDTSSVTSRPPGSPSTFVDLRSGSSRLSLNRTSSGSMIGEQSPNLGLKRTSSGSAVVMRASPNLEERRSHLAIEAHRNPGGVSPIPTTSSSSGASQDSYSDSELPIFESPL